jgi:hypothetical protein
MAPEKTKENPEYEFKKEIAIGESNPPIGIKKNIP